MRRSFRLRVAALHTRSHARRPAHAPTPTTLPAPPRRYDSAFGPQQSNADVYNGCVAPLLARVLEGFNVTVFAYGQTGSGKTFTMMEGAGALASAGGEDAPLPAHAGVAARLIRDLYAAVGLGGGGGSGGVGGALVSARVSASMLEIHNESVYDLLSPAGASAPKSVLIRDNDAGEQVVTGLSELPVPGPSECAAALERGMAARATASTSMNARSSRSHAIFTITLEQTLAGGGEGGEGGAAQLQRRTSRVHLVDLAGSERAKRTGAEGSRLKEGAAINKSLLALGNVINALASAEDAAAAAAAGGGEDKENGGALQAAGHIPYRDSKVGVGVGGDQRGDQATLRVTILTPTPPLPRSSRASSRAPWAATRTRS